VDPDSFPSPSPIDHRDPFLWAALLVLLGSVYLAARLVTWLGMYVALRPWSRARGAHWTELARRAWPSRRVGAWSTLIAVVPLVVAVGRDGRRIDLLPAIVTIFLFAAAAWSGVMQSRLEWGLRLNPTISSLTPRPRRAAWILSLSLSGILISFAFVLYGLVPKNGNAAAWGIIAGGILAVGAYLNWGWSALLRWSGIILPASDRLLTIVSRVAAQMNIRPRSVDEVALPMANAFAFIASGSIGATSAALATLSDEELSAVCAHELGHLSESRWVRLIRLLNACVIGVLVATPAMIQPVFRDTFGDDSALLVLPCALLVCVSFLVIHLRLSRRMEVRADALGRQFEPAPGTYARALEKLYATNLVPVVLATKRQPHPDLYDRMVEAGAPPGFPRPAAPSDWPLRLGVLTVIALTTAASIGLDQLGRALSEW